MDVTMDQVRAACDRAATEQGEWAGAPMPIDHLRLVIAKGYKFQGLNGMAFDREPEPEDPNPVKVRNTWYSRRLRGDVYIFEEDGKIAHCVLPDDWPSMRIKFMMHTIGGSRAWDPDAEVKAMSKLLGLVGRYKFDRYILTGGFIETSKRSGVTYLFRRLRPTLALRGSDDSTSMKILAALCLHPLGHYEDSFAGVMVPTDDLIAHLLLCRADEHGFWKRANHHNLFRASSGI